MLPGNVTSFLGRFTGALSFQAHPLIWIIILSIAIRLNFGFTTYEGDHIVYAYNAYALLKGEYQLEEVRWLGLRFGLILPIALFQLVFGVSQFSCTIYSFLCSIGTVIFIYLIAKQLYHRDVAIISSFLCAIYPLETIVVYHYDADTSVSFFLTLATYLFIKALYLTRWSLLYFTGITIGIAQLCKDNAFFILFFFCIWLLSERPKHFLRVLVGFLSIIFAEWLFFLLATGDPFHKIGVISKIQRHVTPLGETVSGHMQRLFGFPYRLMFNSLYTYSFIIALLYLLVRRVRPTWTLFPSLWYFTMLLLILFFPASIIPYYPIPFHSERIYTVLTPPLLLTLGLFLSTSARIIVFLRPIILISLFATSLLSIYMISFNYKEQKSYGEVSFEGVKQLPSGSKVYADYVLAMSMCYWSNFSDEIEILTYSEEPRFFREESPLSGKHTPLSKIKDGYLVTNLPLWWELGYRKERGEEFRSWIPPEIFEQVSEWEVIYRRPIYRRQSLIGMLLHGVKPPKNIGETVIYRVRD
jgi:hypothetical protein